MIPNELYQILEDETTGPSPLCLDLTAILQERRLTPVFQPIVDLSSSRPIGFEGLIRGPSDSPLHSPLNLFSAADACGMLWQLEQLCRELTLRRYAELALPAPLFLNVSPDCLLLPAFRSGQTLALLDTVGLKPDDIVIELTETRPQANYSVLRDAIGHYRAMGYRIALDDLGEGFSNLRLWSELKPEFVKIDKYFTHGIHLDPGKQQFVRSIVEIAHSTGTRVVAEGIETVAELKMVQKLGIRSGQGYLFARPSAQPALSLNHEVIAQVNSIDKPARAAYRPVAGDLLVEATTVTSSTPAMAACELFTADPELFAVPVVDNDWPVGLLRRYQVLETFAKPFARELYAKRDCTALMDTEPLIVDRDMNIHELSNLVVAAERRYLIDGFIITDGGHYLGMGTGFDLMKKINEIQISAARYANPLTQLPGNVPINETIERLLDSQQPFVIAYCDLDNFKPFNDLYGYHLGDELIQLAGQQLTTAIDPERDFVGHLGGDDFIILLQSTDWLERLNRVRDGFTGGARGVFLPEHLAAGGYRMLNRAGETVFFPLTSMSIGVVCVRPGQYRSHHELAAAATSAKKFAKKTPGGSVFVERRDPPSALAA